MEERELLRILETAFIHLKKDINYKETKRKYQQALEEIVALIKKPEVTEEFIKKKIDEMWIEFEIAEIDCKDFICTLIEEIHGRK